MSRIGKKPIEIPEKVKVKLEDNFVIIKGPNGELKQKIPAQVSIEKNQVIVKSDNNALWGLSRTLIANMTEGVVKGFEKSLEIVGTGYSAEIKGNKLIMKLGFSHPVEIIIPENIEIKTEKNIITISGINKQLVGEIAAKIRDKKKPEPYKGKGIRYIDEIVKIKPGKKAAGMEEGGK